MKTFMLEDILKTDYCHPRYDVDIITRLLGDRESATVLDLLDATLIPVEDRLWLVFELGILEDRTVYAFRARLAFFDVDIYEKYYPADRRVRDCAEAWQKLADGDEDVDIAAAGDAAWAAAWDATGDATGDAWWAVAWAAAGAAAGAAARAAAGAAVWAAAGDAAWAAARAAARAAAWDVTQDAARAAAWKNILAWLREIIVEREE